MIQLLVVGALGYAGYKYVARKTPAPGQAAVSSLLRAPAPPGKVRYIYGG